MRHFLFMCLFFALSFVSVSHATIRSGEITIYGKTHKVEIVMQEPGKKDEIHYDDFIYPITSCDADDSCEGARNLSQTKPDAVERFILVLGQDTIAIYKSNPSLLAQEFSLQAPSELKCGPDDNAMAMVMRAIPPNGVVTVGNCLSLKP